MSATQFEQFDFSLGEISPDYDWRADLKVRLKSLKTARNVRPRYTGSGEARPGSDRLFAAAGDGWLEFGNVDGTVFGFVFTAAQVKIYTRSTRTLVATLTGAPWTAGLLDEIVVATWGKQAFVFHQGFAPQILERADDGTWSRTAWAPADGPGDTTRQPFYRYAARGITVTPGALTGNGVALVASADAFTVDQVGLRLRLQNREVEIASFVDAQNVTVDIKQDLHETVEITLDRTDGFSVGEIVEGATTGARAEVVSVDSATVMTVLKLDFTEFYYEGSATDKREMIVGPNGKSRINAAESAPVTPAAVLDWTEQAMSDYRGWPATGTVHQSRLWMLRLPLVPYGVIGSEIDDFTACEVGTGDSDAIFEEIRDANVGRIRWAVSSENLLILTEERTYYIPTPTPTGIAFVPIDPPGAGACRPVVLSEGIAFSERGGAELIGLFPTGDVRRSWRTQSLSYLAPHLIKAPRSMAYVSPSDDSPERQVYMANTDGTATVLTYTETDADALPSLVPWDMTGTWRCFAAAEGECWGLVLRGGSYQVEAFSTERYMDGVVTTAVLQGAASTLVISTPSGNMDAEFVWRVGEYAYQTCSLMVDGAYIGEVTLDANGDFGTPEGTTILLGFKFAVECVPWPPMDAQDQTARRRKKRIGPVNLRWRGRYLTVDGNLQPVYRAEDDMSLVPPVRDETTRVPTFGGWQDSPTVTIGHPYPGPFILLGISCEVAG